MRSIVRCVPALVILGSSLAACGGAGETREKDESTKQAAIVGANFSMTPLQFGFIAASLNVRSCALDVTDGNAVYTPSAELAKVEYPNDPDPTHHLKKFPIADIPIPMPDPLPAGKAHVSSLHLSGAMPSLGSGEIDVDATATGVVTVSVTPVAFHLVLDAVKLHLVLGSVATPSLGYKRLDVNTQWHIEDCLGGFCDSIASGFVPNLNAKLHDALEPVIIDALADSSTADAVNQVLTQFTNSVGSGAPWTITPGTFSLNTPGATWQATHMIPPKPPTNCIAWATCGNGAGVHCDDQPEKWTLYRSTSSSFPLEAIASATSSGTGAAAYVYDPGEPSNVTTMSYVICASNDVGNQCYPTPLNVKLDPTPCSTGGGGGGGSGSGGGGTWHGHVLE
jgi:hypothetical protein